MSVQELDAEAAREERLERIRAEREARRIGHPSAATAEATPTAAVEAVSFEVVEELPKRAGVDGRPRKPVPAPRQQLIDYAIAHPGTWLKYSMPAGEPLKKPHTLATYVKKHQGGFGPGFECSNRGGAFYLRYVGADPAAPVTA